MSMLSFMEKLLDGAEVEWKMLGEVAKVQRGASPRPILQYITDDNDGVPWIKIGDTSIGSKYVYKTTQKITTEGAKKSRILKKGDFIISNSMSFGRPYIFNIEGAIHDGWASISEFEEILNPDFLYHYLSSNNLAKLLIPIPVPEEQARIVAILDKFDTLTTSLTEGLPREIELRKKQYEYYRDLLLSFPRAEVEA